MVYEFIDLTFKLFVVQSVVPLKIRLHCEGCIQKIKKIILKIKGKKGLITNENLLIFVFNNQVSY